MSECIVLGSFLFSDGTKCEILRFHEPDENMVDWLEMSSRGQTNEASMDEKAFQKFWNHLQDIPSEWRGKVFMFPGKPDSDGIVIRYIYMEDDVWRYHNKIGLEGSWSDFCVLVRLTSPKKLHEMSEEEYWETVSQLGKKKIREGQGRDPVFSLPVPPPNTTPEEDFPE